MSTADDQIASLRREVERLREVMRSRADIVANVTHQLKTPLTSLLGYAMILRKRESTLTTDERDSYLAVIEEQGERILRLIEELLQSTRAEEALGSLQRVPVDLAGIAARVAREMGTGRARTIEVEAPPDDLGLYGDPAALEHVITNLVDNALKYSPPETPVRIAIDEGHAEVTVSVIDEGRGIAPGELDQVFERFRQASNAQGPASVGLGLYIVRTLVEAHGGRVWVASDPGKGATFTFSLPRRRAR